MKLFDSIMRYFDDDSLGLLGAVLGEHEVKVRDGVEAAAAEILCAIGDQTKSEEGGGVLWRELRDTDASVASSFPNQLHYQNSHALVENGREQLTGLVGDDIKAITNRVSHAADIGSSSAGKMVGAVSPLIFSSLAAWQKEAKLDAEGWQKLFAEQSEGLRERAARAATRRIDAHRGQRTFPSFDKKTTTELGDSKEKWTADSGFTPGYDGSAKEKFFASNSNPTSANGSNPSHASKIAAAAAGTAAVAGTAAAGGQASGAASLATTQSSSLTSTSDNAKSGSNAADQKRWVPDKENLRRERERTAIERARVQREQRLAKENKGGLGWLWWQLLLLAGLAGFGWMFRGEISEAFNGAATVVNAEGDLKDDSAPMLPSEETATDSDEAAVTSPLNSNQESSKPPAVNSVDGANESSASSDIVEGTLENTTAGNETAPPSSRPAELGEGLASPATEQKDDSPKLPPMDGPKDMQKDIQEPSTDEDVDLQVETALTSLELGIKEIKDEASAKSTLPKMKEGIAALEELLETSSNWSDVDKELIDIQLEEAAGVFAKLNDSVSSMPKVKSVVSPVFERLEELLVPLQTAP